MLRAEFKSIRAKGYAECVQEIEVGVCSVAAPVHLPNLFSYLSVGATGAVDLFTPQFREKLGQALIKKASLISNYLEKSYVDADLATK